MSEVIIVGKTKTGKPVYGKPCLHCGKMFSKKCRALLLTRTFCGRACGYAHKNSGWNAERRFWKKVDKNGPTVSPELGACWDWAGAMFEKGYGRILYCGKERLASRIAYCLQNGLTLEAIDGIDIRHRCDRPSCVRGSHLEPGTHLDNMRDMMERGRHKPMRGSANGNSRFTETIVRTIKRRHRDGESAGAIARDLAADKSTICRIVRGDVWKHVP